MESKFLLDVNYIASLHLKAYELFTRQVSVEPAAAAPGGSQRRRRGPGCAPPPPGCWRRWASSVLSVSLLLAGCALLLGFMHRFIVPHVQTSMFVLTSCHVVSLCPQTILLTMYDVKSVQSSTYVHENVNHTSDIAISNWTNEFYKEDVCFKLSKKVFSQKPPTPHHHHQVPASHTQAPALSEHILASIEQLVNLFPDNLGRLRRVLALRSRWRLGPLTPATDAAALCPLVVVTSRLSPERAVVLLQDSWVFYNVASESRKQQCACPDCHVIAHAHDSVSREPQTKGHLLIHDQHLLINDSFECFVNPVSHSEIIFTRSSNWVIFNVTFWPTVLIITGFVLAFFSWLYLQYDKWQGLCFYTAI